MARCAGPRGAIPCAAVPSAALAPLAPAAVKREFAGLIAAGARLRVGGTARSDPSALLRAGFYPRYKFELFDTVYYVSNPRKNPTLRFLVAWVMPSGGSRRELFARIFYKDISLVWRCASHYVPEENWIGKGEVIVETRDGWDYLASVEETTDLPFEIQDVLEQVNHTDGGARTDHVTLTKILRNGPASRIAPYEDFTGPRRRASSNPANLVNGGRPVVRFTRKNDPGSMRIARGFEPDFTDGILERSTSTSQMYGGCLERFRILSSNRRIQYLFLAGPRHVWIIPPQTLTTELMSFGVRTVTVPIDDRMCVPAFEYHYLDEHEEPAVFVTQIPPGFAGAPHPADPSRADASAWLDRLPIIRAFRREVLGQAPTP